MDDVFDTTGRPPAGWMHAIFRDGPFSDDVGRCVPGPHPPARIEVGPDKGGPFVYRLATVGSWSDPLDPVALYNASGTMVPAPIDPALEQVLRDRGHWPPPGY
ncbi:hypothetical protein ACFW1A_25655 [Kitasatospora sp. NPDC058965]|uniref:hypothetical protein n=1 Tax=Kitasatospora sp. NPDC058965 TaxID=3346682 RepID=UPI0036C65F92